jgi:O-Antigen ligase
VAPSVRTGPGSGLRGRTFDSAVGDVWRNPVLLLTAVGVAFVTMNGVRPIPGATVADITFALATILLVVLAFRERPAYFSIPFWFAASVVGLGLTVLVSSAANPGHVRNLADGVKFLIALAVTPLLIGTIAASVRRVVFLADLWILGAVVNAAVASIDFAGSTTIGGSITGLYFLNRSAGLAATPNHLGLIAAMALPVALSRALATASIRRAAYLGAVFVLCFGILASGSRAELVAGAVGVVTLPLLHPTARKQILLAFAAGLLVIALATAVVPAARSHMLIAVHRLTGTDPSASVSDSQRRVALREGVSEFRAHPITGNGYAVVRDAHVMYLQLLDAGGIVALPAFLVFAGILIVIGLRLRREPRFTPAVQNLAAAFTTSMVVWLSSGVVSNPIYDRYLYLPAGLVFGLLFASRRQDGRATADPVDVPPHRPSRRPATAAAGAGISRLDGTRAMVRRVSSAPTMRRGVPVLAAIVVAAVVAVGAYALATRGDGDAGKAPPRRVASSASSPASNAPPPSHLLTQSEVDRYPASSPQHALLAWWRASQFVDYRGFIQSFDSQLQRKLAADPNTRQALAAFGGFANAATIKFLSLNRTPGLATAYTQVRYQTRGPDSKLVTTTYPRAFRLVRQGGTWLLQNDDFFQEALPADLRST